MDTLDDEEADDDFSSFGQAAGAKTAAAVSLDDDDDDDFSDFGVPARPVAAPIDGDEDDDEFSEFAIPAKLSAPIGDFDASPKVPSASFVPTAKSPVTLPTEDGDDFSDFGSSQPSDSVPASAQVPAEPEVQSTAMPTVASFSSSTAALESDEFSYVSPAGFDVGSDAQQGMSRFCHLVKQQKKTNCKRRTFRTRRLISGEPCNSRPMGWARGSQDLPAARIISSAGFASGTLTQGETQGCWLPV